MSSSIGGRPWRPAATAARAPPRPTRSRGRTAQAASLAYFFRALWRARARRADDVRLRPGRARRVAVEPGAPNSRARARRDFRQSAGDARAPVGRVGERVRGRRPIEMRGPHGILEVRQQSTRHASTGGRASSPRGSSANGCASIARPRAATVALELLNLRQPRLCGHAPVRRVRLGGVRARAQTASVAAGAAVHLTRYRIDRHNVTKRKTARIVAQIGAVFQSASPRSPPRRVLLRAVQRAPRRGGAQDARGELGGKSPRVVGGGAGSASSATDLPELERGLQVERRLEHRVRSRPPRTRDPRSTASSTGEREVVDRSARPPLGEYEPRRPGGGGRCDERRTCATRT